MAHDKYSTMPWNVSYSQFPAIFERYGKSSELAIVFVPTLILLIWYFAAYQQSHLRQYPGPFLAGWTNGWRVYLAMSGKVSPTMKELHEKYGPVVRTGPNLLDLNIPSLIRTVYNTNGLWRKTDFYKINSTVVGGNVVYNLFSETDTGKHATLKKPIVRHYSISSILATEPLMDEVIDDFCGHLEKRFIETGHPCRLDEWLKHCKLRSSQGPDSMRSIQPADTFHRRPSKDAWDFISAMTFSKRLGYMEKGCDFDGSQHIGDRAMDYLGIVGQVPWLDHWLDKNPIVHIGPPNLANATCITAESLFPRLRGDDKNFNPQNPDFLQYFIDSQTSHPDVVDNATIIGYLLLNVIAGADTTAITMKVLFYYCMRSPNVWKRLNEDVLAAGFDPTKAASYSAARSIPYLDAVAREAMRIHPAASMTLERIMPECGLALPDGSVVPGGTTVGMNPYVIGRNKEVFGADADEFIPDRWLQKEGETDERYQERMRLWNASDLTFGAGSRICIGRHLSQMELCKVVATLIARYGIELVGMEEKVVAGIALVPPRRWGAHMQAEKTRRQGLISARVLVHKVVERDDTLIPEFLFPSIS
ncbi:hypothetical protein PG994_011912 [Apiospora phragmitis]|uniref:Pisatin demethylase n=1 Tax=Apiospora phragmitis TaxID=2905665 RepID=A0ABR1TUH8_9PEZI